MVLPFALKSLQSQTLSAVANDLASEMLDLRILALKTGEAQVMHIFPASSVYAVGKLNSEAAKRKKRELRSGVVFANTGGVPNGNGIEIAFFSNGTATPARFALESEFRIKLEVQRLTGEVDISRPMQR